MSEQKPAAQPAVRPVPKPNVYVDTTAFWNGVREGKLVLQYCPETKQFQHYPRPVSIYTGKKNIEWREVKGTGTIYACTAIRIPGPGLEGRLPLCVATVELDEGVRFIGNVLNCTPEQVKIGARVKLAWDKLNDDNNYPAFELA